MEIKQRWSGFGEDLPELAPIVATETTADGWRGVTADGEIYNVRTGTPSLTIPDSITVTRNGELVGRRQVKINGARVTEYLAAFNRAVDLHRSGRNPEALAAIDGALAIVDTSRARFNRAMMLLALGRWPEGFAEFELCERSPPFQRPRTRYVLEAGLAPWRGEDLAGKRLLLVHDHGLGDTIMMLRYIKVLREMGADVAVMVPPELTKIATQFALAVTAPTSEFDYFSSFLHVLRWLEVVPSRIPTGAYVAVDPTLVAHWRNALLNVSRRRVGVAWSVGIEHDGDFPRSLPIADIVARFGDAEYHSLQIQDRVAASEVGVVCHDFADLADCAALMSLMDEIVSVDTAAIHLAGAIGHPNTTLLLSRWHSWRWSNPLYPDIRIVESGR